MIHPSYTELLDVLSGQEDLDNSMLSRYTIIIAAAKRARQIVDGSEPLISNIKVDKPVSIAVNELYDSKIKIFAHILTKKRQEQERNRNIRNFPK